MKKTINVCEAVLKLKTQITEAKEYILANPNAINSAYFVEQIPVWYSIIYFLEGRNSIIPSDFE
jgi:hypothetical protein